MKKITTLVMTLLCLLSSFVWLTSKVSANNVSTNVAITREGLNNMSTNGKQKLSELLNKLITKINDNGVLIKLIKWLCSTRL